MDKKKIIVPALLSILGCGAVIAGSTYALFTSEAKVNVAITSGKVNVIASIVGGEDGLTLTHKEWDNATNAYVEKTGLYSGDATLDTAAQTLTISNLLPMDKIAFQIQVENKSNVTIQYCSVIKALEDNGLLNGLKVTIDDEEFDGTEVKTDYEKWSEEGVKTIDVTIEMPEDATNAYQDKSCVLSYAIEAIQGNAHVEKYEITYPEGVTSATFPEGSPIVYLNAEGVATYVTDVPTAVAAGASVIYAQEDSTITWAGSSINRTKDIKGDFTIYGNRADFKFAQLAFNQLCDSNYDANVNIYNAKNINIWGYTPKEDGYTFNLSMYGCTNSGNSPVDTGNRMMYITGTTGIVNETLVDCTFENGDSAMYSKADGTYTVKNCKFSNSVTPIKFSHKTKEGNAYVKISNSTFDKCGYSTDMGSYNNPEDAAAIKLKSTSHMEVKLKNVAITNMVSGTAIWLNKDGNSTTDSITGSATNVTIDDVAWEFPSTTPAE